MNQPTHLMPPSLTSEHAYTTPDPLGPPPEERLTVVNGNKILEFPDGSAFVGPNEDEQALYPDRINPNNHKENLALVLSENELRDIGNSLKDSVEEDIASQEQFFESVAKIIEYLGIMLTSESDKEDLPFKGAASIYSPALFDTALEIVISASDLIFKSQGMVDTVIIGNSNEELQDIAERKKQFFNYFFDEILKCFRKEANKTLFWAALVGSVYKKVYICPILKLPVSRFIPVEDFIVNRDHSSHLSASRKTHILRICEKEYNMRVMMGMYREINVMKQEDFIDGPDVIKTQLNKISGHEPNRSSADDAGYAIYEVHADYRIKGDPAAHDIDIPLPYIISIDEKSGNVLSIYRNWDEGNFLKTKKEFFVNYSTLPSLDGEGYGMMHYAGRASEASTNITRQLINSGIYSNFPGGVYQAGIRLENNNLRPAPGEFTPIQTGGVPINQAIQALPYKEPSQALHDLRNEIEDSIKKPSAMVSQKIAEMAPRAPMGTVLALLESLQRVPNAIQKSFYLSFTQELKLFNERFGECLSDTQPYPFLVAGGSHVIMKKDFAPGVNVIPSSDPTTENSTFRLMQAEIMINNAKENPALHNLKFAYKHFYKKLRFPDDVIDKLLSPDDSNKAEPPPPMDPVTTMMAIIKGDPVNAAVWQDHDAYISILDTWIQANPQDPNVPAAMALKKQHEAFKYMVDVFAKLNMSPPQDMSQLTPDQQNQLAVEVAQIKLQEAQEAAAASQPPEPPLDPAKVELEAAKMEAEVAHERNQLELKKLEISIKKIEMEYELKVQEFQQKNQVDQLKQELEFQKSQLEGFKVGHEQALKERDQALKERDSMVKSRENHFDPSLMQSQVEQQA